MVPAGTVLSNGYSTALLALLPDVEHTLCIPKVASGAKRPPDNSRRTKTNTEVS